MVPVGYAVPERILDERVFCGLKQYRITWLNLPESKDSWELASEYDDGAYNGAYLELVEEWEEYKLTDPQYAAPTTTPPHAQVQATNPTNKRKSARKRSQKSRRINNTDINNTKHNRTKCDKLMIIGLASTLYQAAAPPHGKRV